MQYLKKKVVRDGVDLLHVNIHQSVLQVDTIVLVRLARHASSSYNSKFEISW